MKLSFSSDSCIDEPDTGESSCSDEPDTGESSCSDEPDTGESPLIKRPNMQCKCLQQMLLHVTLFAYIYKIVELTSRFICSPEWFSDITPIHLFHKDGRW